MYSHTVIILFFFPVSTRFKHLLNTLVEHMYDIMSMQQVEEIKTRTESYVACIKRITFYYIKFCSYIKCSLKTFKTDIL